MRVEHSFADGDELMHALIASGGHDPEFLTDDLLAAAPLRIPAADYLEWYATLPAQLRDSIEQKWGPPPGDQYVDGEDFVVAGIELGNVVVAIQPPRGYGENQVGIYHDPELPPTHHYLACYRWISAAWGADAIVHLGKHGTLEWTPGKMLALSPACAPDAALGEIPLIYPFVVNDPGEGVQAKRRAHAVIVDHLVPPMMRADTYDELAELEGLLDDYARLEVLDPGKLPGARRADLVGDPGGQPPGRPRASTERPDDVGDARRAHRRLPVRGQGHPDQGRPARARAASPRASSCAGSSAAIAAARRRATSRGCAARSAPPSAWTSRRSSPLPGRAPAPRPAALLERFHGPSASAGDLVDRLEAAHMALLDALAERGWDPAEAAREVCADVLGRERPRRGARAALRLRGGRAADPAHGRRADQPGGRAARPPRPVEALGRADPRASGRAADRPQLLCRRSARAAVRALLGRASSGWPTRCSSATGRDRRAAADGRARRLGHLRDADRRRRHRRGLRAARRAADVASGSRGG